MWVLCIVVCLCVCPIVGWCGLVWFGCGSVWGRFGVGWVGLGWFGVTWVLLAWFGWFGVVWPGLDLDWLGLVCVCML